jgi:hypothetical protein
VADSCRRHYFLPCFERILPFCNFFRKFGDLIAGFLTMRNSFFAITCSPFNQAVIALSLGSSLPNLLGCFGVIDCIQSGKR